MFGHQLFEAYAFYGSGLDEFTSSLDEQDLVELYDLPIKPKKKQRGRPRK